MTKIIDSPFDTESELKKFHDRPLGQDWVPPVVEDEGTGSEKEPQFGDVKDKSPLGRDINHRA